MKPIVFILFAFLLTSCMTVKKMQRHCDDFTKVCGTETKVWTEVRDTTIYRHDTIFVSLPRDTVKITDTIRIVNNMAYLPQIHREFGLIGVDAGVNRSILKINAYLNDSTILQPVHDTITIANAIKEKTTQITVPVKYIPQFYKFTFWIFWLMVAVIIGTVLIKLKMIPISKLKTFIQNLKQG